MARKRKMSDAERLECLQSYVGVCLDVLGSLTDLKLALAIGVSYSTARKLNRGEYSICMRVGTLMKLANASGYRLNLANMTMSVAV